MPHFRDPHNATFFYVEIDGLGVGSFSEVSGLGGQQEVFEIKDGGGNFNPHRFVNRTTYGDITLKRGFWNNFELFGWFEQTALETWSPRKSGSIIMMDSAGNEVCRWHFFRALPTKWDGPQLNAQSGIAVESLTLSPEWVKLAPPGAPPPPPQPSPPPPEPEPEPEPEREPLDMTLDGVNFASGSAEVSPDPNPQLDSVLAELEANPDVNIVVEGHTDSQGSASSNQTLSQQRADAVRDYLINGGLDPGRVTAIGYGEDRPIADNETSAGRAQNRRVDVHEA